jgi:hypothetical protein
MAILVLVVRMIVKAVLLVIRLITWPFRALFRALH